MDNQDQYNEMSEVNQATGTEQFSTRRRVATAFLVLVAALLFGYIVYSLVLSTQPTDNEIDAPAQPELTEQEKALQRLEEFRERETVPPTPEQLERLEQFKAGS